MSRGQPSLDLLRRRVNQMEGQEEDQVNLQQFVIVNQKAEQQVLQINIIPAGAVYFKGHKLYSNSINYKIKTVNNHNYLGFINRVLRPEQQIYMLANDSPGLQIVGAKHNNKSGQILILDLAAYKESLYFSNEFMIASRKDPTKRQKHPTLSAFELLQYKQKYDNIFQAFNVNQEIVVLQSDSVVVQKYLGDQEEFCVYQKEGLIAFSRSVDLKLLQNKIVKVSGPGWLFFQTSSNQLAVRKRTTSYLRTIIVLSLLLMMLQISLVTLL